MNEKCNHHCEGCQEACGESQAGKPHFAAPLHPMSQVKQVIAVMSGKGGVGKSLVSSLLAARLQAQAKQTAILDADITGPSIPQAFALTDKAVGTEKGILPVKTRTGIDVMSINLLLQDHTEPVVWRGPVIAGTVKQFWSDVIWQNEDYMIVDMPPGTGDVPLTVFQSLPVDGIVVVTSPQDLVSMIVTKAVKMAEIMQIPILGLVENLSYFTCPDNGKAYQVFGDSHIEEIALAHHLPVLARIPIEPAISQAVDQGKIEDLVAPWLDPLVDRILAL